jgi:hypothetical protein
MTPRPARLLGGHDPSIFSEVSDQQEVGTLNFRVRLRSQQETAPGIATGRSLTERFSRIVQFGL